MSATIDERVVQMSFDNKQFEQGAQESLATIDKLKQSLDFEGVGNFLTHLGDNVDSSGLDNLGRAAEETKGHFSALDNIWNTIVAGSLFRLGGAITDLGLNLWNQVNPLKQITAGWEGYAEKTEAVQTIMAATREQFSEDEDQMAIVTEQLDRLNWFSDETSYSFLDMTSNIGKFTSQGVKLDDAVTSMMGISNWAAISGAKVSEASRAMYNLSQAMGTGSVKLIDWKSIENANMATVEFKQTAIDTAESMGLLKKVGEDMWETQNGLAVSVTNFNENLSKGAWFTSDVLTATLDKYGKYAVELNGLMELTGDYYDTTNQVMEDLDNFSTMNASEQLAFLSEMSKKTGVSIEDLRKDFEYLNSDEFELGRRAFKAAQEAKTFQEAIDSVKDAAKTAWMNVFEAIFGNYEEAKVIWTKLANGLWEVFVGPISNLADAMGQWNELGGRDLLFGIEDVDPGILGNIAEAFNKVFEALLKGFEIFKNEDAPEAGEVLYSFTEKLHAFSEKLVDVAEKIAPYVEKASTVVASFIKTVIDSLSCGLSFIWNFVKGIFSIANVGQILQNTFLAITSVLSTAFGAVRNLFGRLGEILQVVKFTKGFKEISEALNRVKTAISNFLDNSIFSRIKTAVESFKSAFGKDELGGIGKTDINIIGIISKAFSFLADVINRAVDGVTKFVDAVSGSKVWTTLSTFFTNIGTWFTSTATGKFDIFSFFSEFKKTIAEGFGIGGAFRSAKEYPILAELWSGLNKIRKAFKNTIEAFKTGDIWSLIAKPFERVRDVISKAFESGDFSYIYNWFVGIKDRIVGFATTVGDSLSSVFKDTFVAKWITKIKDAFSGLIETVKGSDVWNSLINAFTSIKKLFQDGFGGLIGESLGETIGNISDKVGSLVDSLVPAKKGTKGLSKVGKALLTVLKAIGTALVIVVGAVAMLVIKVAEFIKTSPLIQKFITFVKNAFANIGPVITKVVEKLKTFVAAIKQNEGFQKFVEALRKVKDILLEFITTKVFAKLTEWVEKLADKFNNFGEGESENGILNFANKVGDVFGKVVEWFSKVGESISGFAAKVKGSEIWQSLTNIFTKIVNGTLEWSDITALLEEVREAIDKKFHEIVDPLVEGGEFSPSSLYEKAKTALSNFANGLLDGWEGTDLSALWDGAKAGGMMFIVGLIALAIGKIISLVSSLSGLPKEGIEALHSVKSALSAYINELRARTLFSISMSILALAGAIIGLAWGMERFGPENVVIAAIIVGILVALCTHMANAIRAYQDGKIAAGALAVNRVTLNLSTAVKRIATLGGIAAVMISFARSIQILVGVAQEVATIDDNNYEKGAKRLLNIAGLLVGAVTLINLSGIIGDTGEGSLGRGLGALGNAATILALAEAVRLMVEPIDQLAEISKKGEAAEKGATLLKTIIWTLSGGTGVSSFLAGIGGAGFGTGVGNATTIIAMAFAIKMMIDPIKQLAELYTQDGEAAQKGANMISGVILVLALGVGAAGALAGVGGANAGTFLGLAVAILAIAAAARLMVKPLEEICNIGGPALLGAVCIAAIVAVIGKAAQWGGAKSLAALALDFLALAVALWVMVNPLKELAALGWSGIAEAVVIGVVIAAIGLGARLADPLQLLSLSAAMLALAGSLWVINEAAKSAGEVSGQGLIVLGTELAIMLAGLVVAVLAIGGAATSVAPGLYALAAAAVGVGLGFALITGSFSGIADGIKNVASEITTTFDGIFSDENVNNMAYEAGKRDGENYTAGATAGMDAARVAYEENLKEITADANNFADTAIGEGEDPDAMAAAYRAKYMPVREEAAATADSLEESADRIVEADKKISETANTSATAGAEKEMDDWLSSYEEGAKVTEDAAARVEASTERINKAQESLNNVDPTKAADANAVINDVLSDPAVSEAIGNVGTANADAYMDSFNTELDLKTEEGKAEYKRILEEGTGTALTEEFTGISEEGLAALQSTYGDYIASITGGEEGDETALIPMMRNAISGEQENFNATLLDFMTQAREGGIDITRPEYYASMLGLMGNNEDGLGPGATTGIYDSQEGLNLATNMVADAAATEFGSQANRDKAYNSAINFGGGWIQGFMDTIEPVIEQVQTMIDGILATATGAKGLDEHSPSKKAIWMAEMFNEGLALGFMNYARRPINAAGSMTGLVLSEMQTALAGADAMLSDNLNPTITPVLDLSNVQNGSAAINDILGNSARLETINAGINSNLAARADAYSTTPTSGNNITNNFNINVTGGPNASARDIANEVMDRINNDIQRRKAAFA